jgi:hypothetical protein
VEWRHFGLISPIRIRYIMENLFDPGLGELRPLASHSKRRQRFS